jgi:hypothetical protein
VSIRRAARRYFAGELARAPYREPPRGSRAEQAREAWGKVLWPLACAAALALALVLPTSAQGGLGSRLLGAQVAKALKSGAIRELGAELLDGIIEGSPFRPR